MKISSDIKYVTCSFSKSIRRDFVLRRGKGSVDGWSTLARWLASGLEVPVGEKCEDTL